MNQIKLVKFNDIIYATQSNMFEKYPLGSELIGTISGYKLSSDLPKLPLVTEKEINMRPNEEELKLYGECNVTAAVRMHRERTGCSMRDSIKSFDLFVMDLRGQL